jgi:hypothetical protein
MKREYSELNGMKHYWNLFSSQFPRKYKFIDTVVLEICIISQRDSLIAWVRTTFKHGVLMLNYILALTLSC